MTDEPVDKMLFRLFRLISLLPMWMLYPAADFLAVVMHYIARYRLKTVRHNLNAAFPELPEKEKRRIERRFYHFLADCFVETVKLASMSEKEMRRRMVFENTDEVNADLRAGRHVALYLGHYGNWEWISSMPLHLYSGAHPCQIYHRLRNAHADKLYLRLRSRFRATCVPMDEALTTLLDDYRSGRPNITGYISDQAPKYNAVHHFIPFLNQETAVITGTERLARMVHASAYYTEVSSPRRGHYVCRFVKLTDDASRLKRFELTDMYWRHLEKTIRRRPELWLWSHKRWKRTMEELKRNYPDDWQKRLNRL